METVRTFIAIQLEPGIQKSLAELQRRLRNTDLQVKWVAPQNIHLTMKFIGDVPVGKLDEVTHALSGAAAGCAPFDIAVAGIGAFPDKTRPRIIWAGVRNGKGQLIKLAGSIETACVRLGFPKEERGFTAHLTIARVKEMHFPQEFFAKAQKFEQQEFGSMAAAKISLIKSTLTPKGPMYDTISEVLLGKRQIS